MIANNPYNATKKNTPKDDGNIGGPPDITGPNAVSPDTRLAKRQADRVTIQTFGNDDDVNKRHKNTTSVVVVSYEMKTEILPNGTPPVNLRSSHPELFLESLQGNIDIIWCNDGIKEGYIDPLMKALFAHDKKDAKAFKVMEELKMKTGIFAAAGRRISRTENQVQMKEGNNGGMFKLTYLIRHRNGHHGNNDVNQRQCLEHIADVSVLYCNTTLSLNLI